MQKVLPGLIVYGPALHRELLPEEFPETIRPIWPGLPESFAAGRCELWESVRLPYTPAEAAACLAAFQHIGEADLAPLAAPENFSEDRQWRNEQHTLNAFAKAGMAPAPEPDEAGVSVSRRRWAQHFLLLGWLQEERALDMGHLIDRYAEGAGKLATCLNDDGDGETGALYLLSSLLPENSMDWLPSWRFMLELFSLLLPENTALCTADSRILTAFAETGLCQDGLPAAQQECLDGKLLQKYRITWGEMPYWQLLGKKSSQNDRPWLDRQQLMLLCNPKEILEQA